MRSESVFLYFLIKFYNSVTKNIYIKEGKIKKSSEVSWLTRLETFLLLNPNKTAFHAWIYRKLPFTLFGPTRGWIVYAYLSR